MQDRPPQSGFPLNNKQLRQCRDRPPQSCFPFNNKQLRQCKDRLPQSCFLLNNKQLSQYKDRPPQRCFLLNNKQLRQCKDKPPQSCFPLNKAHVSYENDILCAPTASQRYFSDNSSRPFSRQLSTDMCFFLLNCVRYSHKIMPKKAINK